MLSTKAAPQPQPPQNAAPTAQPQAQPGQPQSAAPVVQLGGLALTPKDMRRLQGGIGNQAVGRLLQRQVGVQRHAAKDSHKPGCGCAQCVAAPPPAAETAEVSVQRQVVTHGHGCGCAVCARQLQRKVALAAPALTAGPQHGQPGHVCAAACHQGLAATPSVVRRKRKGVIQRHSSYEHYLLGSVAPNELGQISEFRGKMDEVKALQAEIDNLKTQASGGKYGRFLTVRSGLSKDAARRVSELEGQITYKQEAYKTLENDVRHVLTQEMERLWEWKDNPEKIDTSTQEQFALKGEEDNQRWQVNYVRVPVKPDADEDAEPGSDSVVVTYGEINTLPDMFGNLATLANTKKSKVLGILQGVRQQSYIQLDNFYKELFGKSRSKLHKTYKVDDDFAKARGPRAQAVVAPAYKARTNRQLNVDTQPAADEDKGKSEMFFATLERNACHFAPYSWEAWERYHTEAREKALRAANLKQRAKALREENDEAGAVALEEQAATLSNEAVLANAFGDHYLQDSYAAGHLIDKTKIMQWFVQWMNATKDQWVKGKGRGPMGRTKAAKGQWAMTSLIANQDLQSDPQALDDMMHGERVMDVTTAAESQGLKANPEIVFMMWWRKQIVDGTGLVGKHVTPEEVAKVYQPAKQAFFSVAAARTLLKALHEHDLVEVTTERSGRLKLTKTQKYSLKQTQIDALAKAKGGAYNAILAKKLQENDIEPDFEKEAQEFNLMAYNQFLSNAYVQGATAFFHDKFCKEGLKVITGTRADIGRIYGDNFMMQANAQKGVIYSAATAQMSRQAIVDLITGTQETEVPSTADIRARFPVEVEFQGQRLSLVNFNQALKTSGENGWFKDAASTAALLAEKLQDGLSGGNALDVEQIVKKDPAFQVPDHGSDLF